MDPIAFSGPLVGHREVECIAEAARNGWNFEATNSIRQLQKQFCHYSGHKHAHATSSGTGALHLALLALGCRKGMEVLVPEIADISAAAAVAYTGATPVFCDVDPLTLCLDAKSAAARATPRTVGMIVTHLYGQLCDMLPLLDLAKARGLFVIEDATQAMGGRYRGRLAGSFGHMSVFSLNSNAAISTGEGGMVLCSDEKLHKRLIQLGDSGRNEKNPYISDCLGFNYRMSNLCASFGVAQMERLREVLEKKRTIFTWYKERLAELPGIRLNPEVPGCSNSYGMTVLFLAESPMLRRDLLLKLLNNKVACAPTFFPLSGMRMFSRQDNPVAYSVGLRGIVLPSGPARTEEEVDYVCAAVKQLLQEPERETVSVRLGGWLAYKEELLEKIRTFKKDGLDIPYVHDGAHGALKLLNVDDAANKDVRDLLVRWRNEFQEAFLSRHTVNKEHIDKMMVDYPERMRDYLFFFITREGRIRGHVAIDSFDFQKNACSVETLVMETDAERGLAAVACEALYAWLKKELGIRRVYSSILGNNKKSRLLNSVAGFVVVNQTSLYETKTSKGNNILRPMYLKGHEKPDDTLVLSVKEL